MESKDYSIIPESDWKITNWSGGTTSQLFIFPLGSNFKAGDYKLRISIATVEVETSTFTQLKDVNRTLLVLNGELELNHEGHHSSSLKQYDQDSFSGNWITNSAGKVRDFNVMTKGITNSVVRTIKVTKDTELACIENDFIHVLEGLITINKLILKKNNSVVIKTDSSEVILSKNARIVLVRTQH